MKRLISIILSILMLCSLFVGVSVTANAQTNNEDTIMNGSCGENVIWNYVPETFTLTISGTGDMTNYTVVDVINDEIVTSTPWQPFTSLINNVIIEEGVSSIGICAFAGCSNLENVEIPESVTTVLARAFYGCSKLEQIELPNTLSGLDAYVFALCTNLSSITLPDGILYIRPYAFAGCSTLTSVIIPDSVVSIVDGAFEDCTSLDKIIIPNSVTTIYDDAFYGCTSLNNITIPKEVTSIGYGAFEGCTNLRKIIIENSSCTIKESWSISSEYHTIPDNATIYGYKGSTAEEYANSYGKKFVDLNSKEATVNTTITLKKSSASLYIKGTTKIKATVKDGVGKTMYKSSDPYIAKVNANGKVTAKKEGTTTITVTNNGVSKKFKVKVKSPKLKSTGELMAKGDKVKIKIKGQVGKATFKSTKTKVATVNSKGVVKAKKSGTAVIKVKTNGVTLSFSVVVI